MDGLIQYTQAVILAVQHPPVSLQALSAFLMSTSFSLRMVYLSLKSLAFTTALRNFCLPTPIPFAVTGAPARLSASLILHQSWPCRHAVTIEATPHCSP